MLRRRRRNIIIFLLCLIIVGLIGMTLYGLHLRSQTNSDDAISLSDVDKGVVNESEETDIDAGTLKSIKDVISSEVKVGDLAIEPGEYIDDVKSERLGKDGEIEYTPWIDWSDNELTPDELSHMLYFVNKLVKRQIIKEGTYLGTSFSGWKNVEVKSEFPSNENEAQFKAPIIYFVVDGVLTINCELTVYNLDTNKQKTLLAPVEVKYDVDKVVLATK